MSDKAADCSHPATAIMINRCWISDHIKARIMEGRYAYEGPIDRCTQCGAWRPSLGPDMLWRIGNTGRQALMTNINQTSDEIWQDIVHFLADRNQMWADRVIMQKAEIESLRAEISRLQLLDEREAERMKEDAYAEGLSDGREEAVQRRMDERRDEKQ